jgi:hypothetical protein
LKVRVEGDGLQSYRFADIGELEVVGEERGRGRLPLAGTLTEAWEPCESCDWR